MAEALEPGESVSAIAHQLGIHPSQLFGWRRAVLDAGKVSKHRHFTAACQPRSCGEWTMDTVFRDDPLAKWGRLEAFTPS
ncbi:hypothetical protein EFR00_00440 [Rhizobium sophoriradicis]|uniref:transposase n=1 Tax=Rhizobium sophoriradicis TaxID=1535245 RepID=UPI000F7ABEE9|nr:hypothetical protein EFR00_00440 [Rhizobium sophoriradicis]